MDLDGDGRCAALTDSRRKCQSACGRDLRLSCEERIIVVRDDEVDDLTRLARGDIRGPSSDGLGACGIEDRDIRALGEARRLVDEDGLDCERLRRCCSLYAAV